LFDKNEVVVDLSDSKSEDSYEHKHSLIAVGCAVKLRDVE
jgi:hypothetical protein